MVKDLNGDGLDDIYISDFSRLSILLQQPGGEFVANDLPIKASVDMSRSEISFSETSIYLGDQNGDQLDDIMLLENGALMVFEQTSDGRFSDLANQLSLPIAISSRPWWSIRGADGEQLDQSSLKHLMLETIEDINGDSIVDLMLRETNSSGVFDRQNIYQIYFGELQENQLKFNQSANTSIRAEGTLSGLDIIDFNKDGKKEILVSSFDIGVSQIIGALLSGSIDQDVYIFALDDEGKFSKEPLFSEEVDLNFSLSSGRSGQAVLLAADFNGDGLNEMMLSASDNKLAIYQGVKDSELFRST
ncbi:MAG: VCBS repeat-containing protein [Enterobacterales bacterium]|nr:VCBS repeat-containing protein [Enterobacterales bacterium]